MQRDTNVKSNKTAFAHVVKQIIRVTSTIFCSNFELLRFSLANELAFSFVNLVSKLIVTQFFIFVHKIEHSAILFSLLSLISIFRAPAHVFDEIVTHCVVTGWPERIHYYR